MLTCVDAHLNIKFTFVKMSYLLKPSNLKQNKHIEYIKKGQTSAHICNSMARSYLNNIDKNKKHKKHLKDRVYRVRTVLSSRRKQNLISVFGGS